MRIGFLFNHDQVHQVAHSLPIALALAASGSGHKIIVATTSKRLTAEVEQLGGDRIGGPITLVELGLRSPLSKALRASLDRAIPATKLLVYRDNLDFFRSLDILVVAEKTSLVLKTRYGLDGLRMIHTRHGAGDRAIGFDAASGQFDHVLAAGPKIRDRLIAETGLDPVIISVVGYPKFDLAPRERPVLPQLGGERPVVVYNPHVSPHLSSWFLMGRQVLDFFAASTVYDLIFAPHVMLFERRYAVSVDRLRIDRAGRIPKRYYGLPNIHIDLGSRASTDMTYTAAADIYLGDVSSQIYEFIAQPRPAVFLNAHGARWQDNPDYAHWRFGPVIDSVDDLGAALDAARAQTHYLEAQAVAFEDTFSVDPDRPAAERAASAILAFIDGGVASDKPTGR